MEVLLMGFSINGNSVTAEITLGLSDYPALLWLQCKLIELVYHGGNILKRPGVRAYRWRSAIGYF